MPSPAQLGFSIFMLIASSGLAHADPNQSPEEFFQFVQGSGPQFYSIEYIEARNIRHQYNQVRVANCKYAGIYSMDTCNGIGPNFSLRDMTPPPPDAGPAFKALREIGAGSLEASYRGCWSFGNSLRLGGEPYNRETGWGVRFDAIYRGTICAEGKEIIITVDIYAGSGLDIAAKSRNLGTCQEPTQEYLTYLRVVNNPTKAAKIECVYSVEHHKVKFTP